MTLFDCRSLYEVFYSYNMSDLLFIWHPLSLSASSTERGKKQFKDAVGNQVNTTFNASGDTFACFAWKVVKGSHAVPLSLLPHLGMTFLFKLPPLSFTSRCVRQSIQFASGV